MQENKMGTMPVNRLILTVSFPLMISMLVQSLYNIIDSIFVAQISEKALTAVTLAFPIQHLMIAVQVGSGVGMNALLSRRLGEKRFADANDAAIHGVFLSLIHYLVFLVFGLTVVVPFFESQTNDPEILRHGIEYLTIVMCFSMGKFFQFTFERMLQATGRTFYTMITQGAGALFNIVLDPILIFGLFGMPQLGVRGAAIATVIAQISAASLAFYFNRKKNTEVTLRFRKFRPKWETVKGIYSVGIPSMVMSSVMSVTTFALNNILLQFSASATAVYGAYTRLQSFVFMPIFGLNNGMIPVVAYNYGAQNKNRLIQILRVCSIYATGIMTAGLLIFQLFPESLLKLFNASGDMLAIGVPAVRIISLGYVFAGFSIVMTAAFQAFGKGMTSLMVSLIRQLIVLVPLAYLFSLTGNVSMVWWAYPASELTSVVLCAYFIRSLYYKIIEPMPEETQKKSREPQHIYDKN
ncbi:MATE family efflux transporter [Atopococcus tabaci]|uniref:MATE family efflux transporter n=1 Tax=Atopococcus tabaci TaxID=269774 RepID=UPI002409AF0F|nr:MATE family efflux transporter [Atopococcus tabaci]